MTKQNKRRAILAAILAIIIAICTAALSLIDEDSQTKPDVIGTVQEVQAQIETIKELRESDKIPAAKIIIESEEGSEE